MRQSGTGALAFAGVLGVVLAQDQYQTCESWGVDFQDKGSYFQNKSSSDPFTFVSTFEGCQNDVANNILVDPTGEQYLCSDTPLTPPDTYQMSTCPLDKDDLWSGAWSVIIISNNGDAEPIAYQRDFSLEVAVPVTTTYTPTLTVSATTTPIIESTIYNTITETITNTKTVTSKYTKSKTITKTPKKVTTTKTQILGTITKHAYTVIPTVVTKTKTLTCSIPKRQPYHDPWARITPTVVYAAALETASLTTSVAATTTGTHRRRDAKRHVAADNRAEFLAAREARLADAQVIQKRGLDNGTVTLTELDTSKWATSTSMSTAPATTTWLTQDVDTSITTTSTETFWSGVTKVVITVTAPTPTKTKTKYTIVKTTATTTRRPTVTVTIKTAPAASTTICKAKGGKLV